MPRHGKDHQSGAGAHGGEKSKILWTTFDAIWIMEGSEHFPDKKHFFERRAVALKPGGTLAVCASLDSLSSYMEWMRQAGLTVTAAEDIARQGANPVLKFLLRFTASLKPSR
jgi:hypothetical protein